MKQVEKEFLNTFLIEQKCKSPSKGAALILPCMKQSSSASQEREKKRQNRALKHKWPNLDKKLKLANIGQNAYLLSCILHPYLHDIFFGPRSDFLWNYSPGKKLRYPSGDLAVGCAQQWEWQPLSQAASADGCTTETVCAKAGCLWPLAKLGEKCTWPALRVL